MLIIASQAPNAGAVDAGDNKVLVVGGYELGATILKIDRGEDGTYTAQELFTTEEFGDQTKLPIAPAEGRLLIRDRSRLMFIKVSE
jgi:hypothetical protein